MKCGWCCGEQLTASRMRVLGVTAPLSGTRCARTSHYARTSRRPPTTWTDEGETRKPSVAAHRDRECCAGSAAERDSRQRKWRGECAAGTRRGDLLDGWAGTTAVVRQRQVQVDRLMQARLSVLIRSVGPRQVAFFRVARYPPEARSDTSDEDLAGVCRCKGDFARVLERLPARCGREIEDAFKPQLDAWPTTGIHRPSSLSNPAVC
jgi:hypothetical protein